MKKKNLLSLGALALSLGLVVSGCSTPGQKGDTGETGPQGPQGEPGTPGADGKSFADIIVLNDSTDTGFHISQDVYAVEVGSNESVTFTFYADEGYDFDLIYDLVINGVEQEVIYAVTGEDGKSVATLTVENAKIGNSLQVSNASFATVDTYGEVLIYDYYDGLAAADSQLALRDATKLAQQARGDWFDETVLAETKEQVTELKEAVADFDEDLTVEERVAELDKLVAAAEEAIKGVYDEVITEAKGAAKEALANAFNGVKSTYKDEYKDEDLKAQIDAGNAAIDGATTLAGLTAVWSEKAVNNNKGTYNKLCSDKSAAFQIIKDALATIPTDALDQETLEGLEEWGVEVSSLPKTIAENYYAQISAATSFELNKDGDSVLAVEGATAIKNSYTGLFDKLYENIKNAYLAEVDASKVLATTEQKTVAKSAISNAAENWDAVEHTTLKEYFETESVGPTSLVEALEEAFENLGNAQFDEERVVNAKASAIAKFEEIVNKINEDAGYVAAVGYTVKNGVTTPTTKEYALTADIKVDNPFFTKTTVGETVTYTAKDPGTLVKVEESATLELKDYSVTNWLEALKKDTPTNGVLGVKDWEAKHLDDFDAIYGEAKTLYTDALKAAAVPTVSLTYITSASIREQFDEAIKNKDFAGILEVAQNTSTSREILTTLDGAVAAHVTKVSNFDKGYDEYFSDKDSIYKDDFDALVKEVISGTKGQTEVTNFIAETNLDAEYQKDVVAYLEDAKVILNEAYQNKIIGGTVEDYRKVLAVKEAFDGFVGHYVVQDADGNWTTSDTAGVDFRCTTLTSVDHWLSDALTSIGSSTVEVTNGLTLGVVAGSDSEWENAADFKVSGSNGNYKATGTAVKLSETQATHWGANGHVVMIDITTSAATSKVRTAYLSSADADFPTNPSDYKTNGGYKELSINGTLELAVGIGELTYADGSTIDYTDTPYLCVLELDTTGKVIGRIVIDLTGVELPA